MTPSQIQKFQGVVLDYYDAHKRKLAWREHIDPYHVLISEVMLQQTQVPRILVKFPEFVTRFPTLKSLASGPAADVFGKWQGIGYNRRAKYLHDAAQIIVNKYGAVVPSDPDILVQLPGIGPATAASIACFAYDKPVVFIETNIRRAYIHHFFADQTDVHDRDIIPLVAESLPPDSAREWYYALMDYGAHLGKVVKNPNRKSRHYARQSAFEGSSRQVRGAIIRALTSCKSPITSRVLEKNIHDGRFDLILQGLVDEGLVKRSGDKLSL